MTQSEINEHGDGVRWSFVFGHGASGRGGRHYPQFMNKTAQS